MSSKEQGYNQDKASPKQRLPQPASKNFDIQTDPHASFASIIQRARINPRSLAWPEVRHLQHVIGNQEVSRLFDQHGTKPADQPASGPAPTHTIQAHPQPANTAGPVTGVGHQANRPGLRKPAETHIDRHTQPAEASAGRSGVSSQLVIQRDVGLEIEGPIEWRVYDQDKRPVKGGHVVLFQEGKIRLETELSGKLEFVIEPPAATTAELIRLTARCQDVARQISQAKGPYIDIVKELGGSYPGFIKKPDRAFEGAFQATVGVPLSAVPALFQMLRGDAFVTPGGNKPQFDSGPVGPNVEQAMVESMGLPLNAYHQLSPEMQGLLHLIYYYFFVGETAEGHAEFPKGLTRLMARTNFAKMFSLTPEAKFLSQRPDVWVQLVTEAAGLDPDEKIFPGTFGEHYETINITRRQWLVGMASAHEPVDKLSVKGGGPEILKTMGDTEKTDKLGVPGKKNEGAILEIRALEGATVDIDGWVAYAKTIGTRIDELTQRVRPEEQNDARGEIYAAGGGGALEWAPTASLREAGQDIGFMALEAFDVAFRSQVSGLMAGARMRAETARTEANYQYAPNRLGAVKTLETKGPEAVRSLIDALRDPDETVRASAVLGLMQFNVRRAIKPLVAALGDPSAVVHSKAFVALRQIGQPAVKPLIAALGSKNVQIREQAVDILSKMPSYLAVKSFIIALGHENPIIRHQVGELLVALGPNAANPLVNALGHPDLLIQNEAKVILHMLGSDAVTPLSHALGHQNGLVRRNAIIVLEIIGPPAVDMLMLIISNGGKGLLNPELAVQNALVALNTIAPGAAKKALSYL